MEIRLNFDENKFRELYEASYQILWEQMEERMNKKSLMGNTIAICALLFFILMILHFDWIYYGLIFFAISTLLVFRSKIIKMKTERTIEKSRREVDDFIATISGIKDVKYVYDDKILEYFESGKVVKSFFWVDLIAVDNGEAFMMIHFVDKSMIMIPRSMVYDKLELEQFEDTVNEQLRNR